MSDVVYLSRCIATGFHPVCDVCGEESPSTENGICLGCKVDCDQPTGGVTVRSTPEIRGSLHVCEVIRNRPA